MKKIILLVLVLVLGLAVEVAKADFTFGTPTNLGSTVNSPTLDGAPSVTADGLSLFFNSQRSGGYGHYDVWVSTRQTTGDPWGEPVNLGSTINTSSLDGNPSISPDGLTLHFTSNRPGGYGGWDIYVTTRATVSDPWGAPVNLGPPFSSSASDHGVSAPADGLSLYFGSDRPDGFGNGDIYMSTRATVDDPWGEPVNLGPVVNSPSEDGAAMVSADGLSLYFHSNRPDGYGGFDIWVTTRATTDDDWGTPVNLGPIVNTSTFDGAATISADCSTLYFMSGRPGGTGSHDLWQVSIEPVVDLNGDGIVDCADMCIIVDHWGENYPLCDIGPMPWGDGIVDVQDLIVLAEHLFEQFPPVELEEVNVDEEDYGSQVELEQGQILLVTLESNPTTGYGWEVAEIQESILEQLGDAEFKQSETGEPPLVGAGGWEIFRFKAISAGQMTLKLGYRRPWEEGVEPIDTFSIDVVVN